MSPNFFQSIVKKLFRAEPHTALVTPFVAEKLVRNGAYAERFASWKNSDERVRDLSLISEVWEDVRVNGRRREMDFFRYESDKSNGFFFNPNLGLKPTHFAFLLDYFKDVLTANGYSLYMSDRRYNEKGDKVECIERHYLKPEVDRQLALPISQLYGNVVIEYIQVDGDPAYLKLMANVYSDRNYARPQPFKDLTALLFI